ncbi:hypothetical protein CONPUDRAFT_140148 [Coniophora puteana RWD-64-598 SS2]|uniref:Uncharacterized protein n=1 Tax=Coniophora puteana (strain RWD-64-598) TaxID=741705 RepID=A0A5M3M7H5_CONPW|nr:uncharacterized protein CONPUDRAFT_140148 [Coniophora puteana RWD-64-598 SS2]EIW75188.1 hypothetical protein CONPUDRAFT_140148 [Coniophora puteana RWD-64-598 SS2]
MSVDATKTYPALFGDGKGHYKVHIVGNSGDFHPRTTLGEELAKILGVPHLPLDTLQWEPNWTPSPRDKFRTRFQEFLDQNPNGWVIDGNYYSVLRDFMEKHQTDVIWLDPPFWLYFPRLLFRTFRRLLGLEPSCSPGCDEDWREAFFSKESIILWCITQHSVVQKREKANMRDLGIESGGIMRRFGGWGYAREMADWKREIEVLIRRGELGGEVGM